MNEKNTYSKIIFQLLKTIEKEEKKYDYGAENKLDISGNFIFILGEGKRHKKQCKANHLEKCKCKNKERFRCPFYERLRIEKYLKNKAGVKTHVFERDLSDNYVLLKAEEKRIKEFNGFLVILYDSPGPMEEYKEFRKDIWFTNRIVVFLRHKFYPFSAECKIGITQQNLIKTMFQHGDIILPIENQKSPRYIEKNSEIITRSMIWFIYYKWPLRCHGSLLKRLLRYFHIELS